jgi:hypothetical protein
MSGVKNEKIGTEMQMVQAMFTKLSHLLLLSLSITPHHPGYLNLSMVAK